LPQNVGDDTYSGVEYNHIQSSRAQFYDDVYTGGEQSGVAGFIFWNMGCEIKPTGYDVGPHTPAVWHIIQEHAPDTLATATGPTLC